MGLSLVLLAGVPRILGALFLPNTFGDAYVYIRDIGLLTSRLKSGTFAITDLYGFWLPLYQLISAVLNVPFDNGFYAGKIVSAIFGVGSCLWVYAITRRLVGGRAAAFAAFALIALSPLHILNSAGAMTDLPHSFFVLGSLFFVLKRRWIVAAVFAALAGLTRVESWMLLALVPLIQIFQERRISPLSVLLMLMPPMFWFFISWKAAGDWLACFKSRQQYHDWLLIQNPALAHFSFPGVLKDAAIFVSSIDLAVLVAAFVAGWMVLKSLAGRSSQDRDSIRTIFPAVIFFFAFFALLVAAYLTHQQPIIFPRYGLILFSLGIPILAWTYFKFTKRRPEWSRRIVIAVFVVCLLNFAVQTIGAMGELNRYRTQRAVADYLRNHFDSHRGTRIFCDEGTVQALSAIPADRFLTSSDAPKDADHFVEFLTEKNVEFLVFANSPSSTPRKLFPELGNAHDYGPFAPVINRNTEFLPTNIWLYRRKDPGF